MKTTIDTSLAITGDLALVSLSAQGLFWRLYCISIERSGPAHRALAMGADGELDELEVMDLITIDGDMIGIPMAQALIDDATRKKRELSAAAKRRWKKRPPTVDEVAEYCESEGLDIDPAAFHGYYEFREWKTKGGPVTNWQGVAKAWAKRKKRPQQQVSDVYSDETGGW